MLVTAYPCRPRLVAGGLALPRAGLWLCGKWSSAVGELGRSRGARVRRARRELGGVSSGSAMAHAWRPRCSSKHERALLVWLKLFSFFEASSR